MTGEHDDEDDIPARGDVPLTVVEPDLEHLFAGFKLSLELSHLGESHLVVHLEVEVGRLDVVWPVEPTNPTGERRDRTRAVGVTGAFHRGDERFQALVFGLLVERVDDSLGVGIGDRLIEQRQPRRAAVEDELWEVGVGNVDDERVVVAPREAIEYLTERLTVVAGRLSPVSERRHCRDSRRRCRGLTGGDERDIAGDHTSDVSCGLAGRRTDDAQRVHVPSFGASGL